MILCACAGRSESAELAPVRRHLFSLDPASLLIFQIQSFGINGIILGFLVDSRTDQMYGRIYLSREYMAVSSGKHAYIILTPLNPTFI